MLSLPISLYTLYLQLYVPGMQPHISFMPVLYSLLITVYLVWVLRKTSPAKAQAPPKTPSKRAIVVLFAGIALVFIGYVGWD